MKPGPAISAVATPVEVGGVEHRLGDLAGVAAERLGQRQRAVGLGVGPVGRAHDGVGAGPPATASKAGWRRAVRTWRGSAMGTAHCGVSAPLIGATSTAGIGHGHRGQRPRSTPLTCTPRHIPPS